MLVSQLKGYFRSLLERQDTAQDKNNWKMVDLVASDFRSEMQGEEVLVVGRPLLSPSSHNRTHGSLVAGGGVVFREYTLSCDPNARL